MRAVRRHDLFVVGPDAWARLCAARADLDGVPHVEAWARNGWPVIVRRRFSGEGDHLPAGLPLPPADGKRRIGLAVPWPDATPHPPVTLATARTAAPPAWQPAIDAVLALAAEHDRVACVFGGLLWQSLTGLSYLTATSDLDLIWTAPVPRRFLDRLFAIEAAAPMRLDGEVVLPDGAGVNWRELRDAPPGGSVLAKGLDGIALAGVADFVAGTPGAPPGAMDRLPAS